MGEILIKKGVTFAPLAPAGAQILSKLKQVVDRYDFDVTITSGNDGTHSGPKDPHHSGEAFDLRTNTLAKAQKQALLDDLKAALYKPDRRFYVLLERPGKPGEHIHVQRRAGTTYDFYDFLADL